MANRPLPVVPACFGKLWEKVDPLCAGGPDPATGTRLPCMLYASCGEKARARPA